jgi:hypothetical protein
VEFEVGLGDTGEGRECRTRYVEEEELKDFRAVEYLLSCEGIGFEDSG